jgi:hypothetical protein
MAMSGGRGFPPYATYLTYLPATGVSRLAWTLNLRRNEEWRYQIQSTSCRAQLFHLWFFTDRCIFLPMFFPRFLLSVAVPFLADFQAPSPCFCSLLHSHSHLIFVSASYKMSFVHLMISEQQRVTESCSRSGTRVRSLPPTSGFDNL